MRDFIRDIANDRSLYVTFVLLNAPGLAAYILNAQLPPALTHSVFFTVAGVVIIAFDALVILAYILHGILSLVDYLMDR